MSYSSSILEFVTNSNYFNSRSSSSSSSSSSSTSSPPGFYFSYRTYSSNYDHNGNMIEQNANEYKIDRDLLQNVSNVFSNALYHLASEIQDYYIKPTPILNTMKYKDIKNKKEKTCSICLDHYENNSDVSITPCIHFYHQTCIEKWLENNSNCPYCRTQF